MWLAIAASARSQVQWARQSEREIAAAEQAHESRAGATERTRKHEEACARRDLLLVTAGAAIQELQARLRDAETRVRSCDADLRVQRDLAAQHAQERARCEQRATDSEAQLEAGVERRVITVERLRGFAATGLLGVAIADLEIPEPDHWTVDPALQLARRIETQLVKVAAEDSDWERAQTDVSRDYTNLGQSLSALGQRATLEQTDYGMTVQIVYGNRAERPDLLERQLTAEAAQRRDILSAREREVLENYLQAEVAANLQRLLRLAEDRVARINSELKRRPTTTGVYFRLDWEPLPEGDSGAPIGLAEARARLLRRVPDAWSADDRRVLGDFLKARIDAERAADDAGPLIEHLTRALDYRRWHRFRVKRWHDGAFRPLTGPASSGERALGLTVPLFAAASSYYETAASPHAPRLVLLDEAFAGIDDEARSHCMGLIREFDLDFVLTSEREWGCYATLPGVSICQIIRREGIDGVFVSRWTWDGHAKREERDPERRIAREPA
jgi:uncharacterized protein (TIGR02680 family)